MAQRKSKYPSKEELQEVLGNGVPEEHSYAEGVMMRARIRDLNPLQKRIREVRMSVRVTHTPNILFNARG
jgi:hypothetical protein